MAEIEELDLEQGQKVEDLKDADDILMSRMHTKLEALPEKDEQRCTIFRVPENIRMCKPHLFEPAVVSIGPYHRSKEHLRAMEEIKWPLLRQFLVQSNDISLKTCITEMRVLEAQARECYNETIPMDSNDFVEMMLLDASFIIQFFFTMNEGKKIKAIYNDAGWNAAIIEYDLILIENQIPFFILEKMCFYLYGETFNSKDLINIVERIGLEEFMSTNTSTPPEKIYHLLHLCHHYILPNNEFDLKTPINDPDKTRKHSQFCPSWIAQRPKELIKTCLNLGKKHKSNPGLLESFPCATELLEAGIKIIRKKPPCHFTDITFQSGILEIPIFSIHDMTTLIVMNLIVLEQGFIVDVPKSISTYLVFIDNLVNTANDVTILERQGIIENLLSSEDEVALFFNQACPHVIRDMNHLSGLYVKINEYCNKRRHRYRAKLMRDYFNNPWSVLSLGAGLFLLLLTSVQTFYTIFAYHDPPH